MADPENKQGLMSPPGIQDSNTVMRGFVSWLCIALTRPKVHVYYSQGLVSIRVVRSQYRRGPDNALAVRHHRDYFQWLEKPQGAGGSTCKNQ